MGDVHDITGRPESLGAAFGIGDLLPVTLAVVHGEQVQFISLGIEQVGQRHGVHPAADDGYRSIAFSHLTFSSADIAKSYY